MERKSLFLILFIAGAALRIFCAQGELWLDEIWSIRLVSDLQAPWAIFFNLHSDNNHLLNSLFLWILGPGQPPFLYRSLSVITAIGSIALIFRFAAELQPRFSQLTANLAVFLYALSFVMILYGSEARGYAPSLFFALVSFLALKDFLLSSSLRSLALIWCGIALGFLSHYTFGFFYLALFLWQIELAGSRLLKELGKIAAVHSVPAVVLALLYYFDFRNVPEGSGTFYPFVQVWLESFAMPLGTKQFSIYNIDASLITLIVALGAAVILLAEIIRLKRSSNSLWVFFAAIIFFVPICTVVLLEPRVFYLRYFFLPCTFGLILFSAFLARMWSEGGLSRAMCGAMCALILIGNTSQFFPLLTYGRGGYLQAFKYIAEHSASGRAVISADQSFRAGHILGYYQKLLPQFRKLKLERKSESSPSSAEWFILQHEDRGAVARAELTSQANLNYRLAASFPHAGLSGATWFLYRQE